MSITIENLKKVMKNKGYIWYTDRPNLIGVRTTLDIPDSFNDFFCIVYYIPEMSSTLSLKQKQSFLNNWGFIGVNGKKLTEDGLSGKNTNYAISQYELKRGKEDIKIFPNTTNPGVYWMKHPMNKLGAAVLKPGQWVDCWSRGYHIKSSHRALRQTGSITVYRDNDKNNTYDLYEATENSGYFGINIHGSGRKYPSKQIGRWSAGCQVFSNWEHKEFVMDVCDNFKSHTNNKFTYTLLNESDLG